ncbi:hypothetical protein [Anaerospora sp.]|uniref:hypothetical protein n=1 Tax=Anaerospora sp. TaxID=1960278 RepID=UPI0028A18065|nr:hypothetical protein [Anaerospora sp.]
MTNSKKYSKEIFSFQFSKRYTSYSITFDPKWHTPEQAVQDYIDNLNKKKKRIDANIIAFQDVKYQLMSSNGNKIKIEIPKNEKYQDNNPMIYVYLLLCYFDIDGDGELKYYLKTIVNKINNKLTVKRIGQITCDLAAAGLIQKDMKIKRATTYKFSNNCLKNYIYINEDILLHPKLSPSQIVNYIRLKIMSTNKDGKFTIYKTNDGIRKQLNISQKNTWIKLKNKYIELGFLEPIDGGFILPHEKAEYEEIQQMIKDKAQEVQDMPEQKPPISQEIKNDELFNVLISEPQAIVQFEQKDTKIIEPVVNNEPKPLSLELKRKQQLLMDRRKAVSSF